MHVGLCHTCPCSKHVTCDGVVLMVLSQTILMRVSCMLLWMQCWVMSCMPVQQACNLCWCCPHGALTNNVVVCAMHAEVGSCHFNILLVGGWCIFFVCHVAGRCDCVWASHAYISMQWSMLHRCTTLPHMCF
jgi:hypothetical protein